MNGWPLSTEYHKKHSVKTSLVVPRGEPVGPLHQRPDIRDTIQLTAQQEQQLKLDDKVQ